MDPLILGIVGLFIMLIITIGLLVVYTGVFEEVDVNTGKPPMANVRVAYKFATGPYADCGYLFTEALSIAPNNRTIGVYYDDPKQVEPNDQRYIVGAILSEGNTEVDKELEDRFLKEEFKLASFPAVDYAVTTSFPYMWALSTYIANFRVWPKLGHYIQERNLCAYPAIEIYAGDQIQYMMPLSKQEEFYVEEAKKAKLQKSASFDETLESNVDENDATQQDTTASSCSRDGSSGSESSFEELSLKDGECEASES